MSDADRRIEPTGEYHVSNASVPAEPIGIVEDVVEDGELTLKQLMVGEDILFVEAFKGKGMLDPMHTHVDHESVGYLLSGRLRLVIDGREFVAEPGDTWIHPRGVPHQSEALEDSVQLEVKSPPRKTWRTDSELADKED